MIEKEFIPYELALDLKELGFDETCFSYYEGESFSNHLCLMEHNGKDDYIISAPLYQQAFRWFREKHNLDLSINTVYTGYNELTTKNYSAVVDDCGSFTNVGFYKTYEEAELACLKKLIEIVKERRN